MKRSGTDAEVERRAALASLHALGVLDAHDDPLIAAVTSLAGRMTRGSFHLWLRGPVPPPAEPTSAAADGAEAAAVVPALRPVTGEAGTIHHDPLPELCLPLVVAGVPVGEIRGHRVSRAALRHVTSEVQSALQRRFDEARRDDRGRPVGVIVTDQGLNILWVSDELVAMNLGNGSDLVGSPVLDLVHPDQYETAVSLMARGVRASGRSTTVAVKLHTASGDTAHFDVWTENRLGDSEILARAFVIREAEPDSEMGLLGDQMFVLNRLSAGEPLGEVLHRVIDMLEHRDPEAQACIMEFDPVDEALHPLIAPHLPVPVVGALIGLKPRLGGPGGSGAFHADASVFTTDVATDPAYAQLAPVLLANGIRSVWSVPIRSFNDGGRIGTIDVFRSVTGHAGDADSRVLTLAARLAAIAIDQDSRERELRHQAMHDPLTGLPNRAMFVERLEEAAEDGNVGVLFIDLDRFKLVNDTLGHEFGDEVLQAVARRLHDAIREPVLVSRFGGDEFTVLVPKVEVPAELVRVGEQLLAAISQPYEVRDHRVVLRASAGAALALAPPDDPRSLVRDADTALYHAKDRGRGRVEVFDDQMLEAGAERVRIEGVLREAIESDGIAVHFQPTIRLADGAVIGAEALARCEAPTGGSLPPVLFIPVAEEVGLIPALFETVLTKACAASSEWNRGRSEPFVVWVNLSPTQLGSVAVVEQIARIFTETGVDPSVIGFEVTESGILDPLEAADFLAQLRALGAKIAIDDFGTGYSSLGYLQSLPVDTVKLDRSFVVRAGDDPRSRAIVGSVVDLTNAMSLGCVAEGVETVEQLEVVTELGCPTVQGFVFARPCPVDELTAWLADRPGS